MTEAFMCGLCDGDGETGNPGNADPTLPLDEWLPPVLCPRCGGTGVDPRPTRGRELRALPGGAS